MKHSWRRQQKKGGAGNGYRGSFVWSSPPSIIKRNVVFRRQGTAPTGPLNLDFCLCLSIIASYRGASHHSKTDPRIRPRLRALPSPKQQAPLSTPSPNIPISSRRPHSAHLQLRWQAVSCARRSIVSLVPSLGIATRAR
jgi:hypothetical protein